MSSIPDKMLNAFRGEYGRSRNEAYQALDWLENAAKSQRVYIKTDANGETSFKFTGSGLIDKCKGRLYSVLGYEKVSSSTDLRPLAMKVHQLITAKIHTFRTFKGEERMFLHIDEGDRGRLRAALYGLEQRLRDSSLETWIEERREALQDVEAHVDVFQFPREDKWGIGPALLS